MLGGDSGPGRLKILNSGPSTGNRAGGRFLAGTRL